MAKSYCLLFSVALVFTCFKASSSQKEAYTLGCLSIVYLVAAFVVALRPGWLEVSVCRQARA